MGGGASQMPYSGQVGLFQTFAAGFCLDRIISQNDIFDVFAGERPRADPYRSTATSDDAGASTGSTSSLQQSCSPSSQAGQQHPTSAATPPSSMAASNNGNNPGAK